MPFWVLALSNLQQGCGAQRNYLGVPVNSAAITVRMAKTAANDPPQAEDTDRLKSDVKSFAAQLGFGSIPATGFDYEDFAPQNAKQKIKHAAPKQPETAKPKSKDQNKVPPAGVPKFRHNDKEQARQQSHAQSNNDPKTFKRPVDDDAIRERGWRESVGPRPGQANHVS